MMTLQKQLGYSFANSDLLTQALTHKSFHHENLSESISHNERLEFLGDAVLDLSLSHLLMETFPEYDEGRLSKMRASLVNEEFLSSLAVQLKIDSYLRLGKGEEKSGGRTKPRLLSSTFEAIIGGAFLDSNYDSVHKLISQLFAGELTGVSLDSHQVRDFKTQLQEYIQLNFKETPNYRVINESGPDHEKSFEVEVFTTKGVLATGIGRSKKNAEQKAAEVALREKDVL